MYVYPYVTTPNTQFNVAQIEFCRKQYERTKDWQKKNNYNKKKYNKKNK